MSAVFLKFSAMLVLAVTVVAPACHAQGSTLQAAMQPAPMVPWPPAPPASLPVVTSLPVSPATAAPHAAARYRVIPLPAAEAMPRAQPVVARVPAPAAPALDPAAADIRAALQREVPGLITPTPQRRQRLLELAQATLRASDTSVIDRPQLMLVVDRNPRVQEVWLVVTRADAPWDVLGGTRVSTGTTGRFDHYITPTGVFRNTADILGYRAEGTYNENHIRGNGTKGMRVWDFGWQWAAKGWRSDRERGQIRLEMHATDPDNLAHQIGRTASSGCIRIPDAMNRFLDRHGAIDADYERAAVDDIRFRALLLPDRIPTPLAGNAVIVIDSSE